MGLPKVLAAVTAWALFSSSASADVAADGRLAYASWECAAISTLSESYSEQGEALFRKGHELLGQILIGMENGNIEADVMQQVPVGISWRLEAGPSIDFQLGALWTHFTNDAYDETWPNWESSTFEEQRTFQARTADTAFRDKNCEFVVSQ